MLTYKAGKVLIKVESSDRGRLASEEVIDEIMTYMRQSHKIPEG